MAAAAATTWTASPSAAAPGSNFLLEDGWLPAAFGMGLHQEAKLHVALGGSWRSADLILCEGAYLRWPQESQDERSQVDDLRAALASLLELVNADPFRFSEAERSRVLREARWVLEDTAPITGG
ncbi:hypothetical protein [Deinococcus apachensis]|uniref:hypothetical protein n=1 Tax=Deinococcus apachensis TaxID=309886 RepID=UPI00037FE84F|nr:hypothetical protein [Deinococcus apachensis]